ncbi:MAG: cell division protein ZapA [Gammaproteobacteria bacterium]|nr:cell division protein ZapA [Gammaproteobacteria bacterium]
MSSEADPVTVHILDKDYLVACPEHERPALQTSVQYLNRKMKEIRDSGKVIGTERIAVMAALNIAHEVLQHKTQKDISSQDVGSRIRALQEKIDHALQASKQMEL